MSERGAHTKIIPSHPIVEYHPYTIVNTTTICPWFEREISKCGNCLFDKIAYYSQNKLQLYWCLGWNRNIGWNGED